MSSGMGLFHSSPSATRRDRGWLAFAVIFLLACQPTPPVSNERSPGGPQVSGSAAPRATSAPSAQPRTRMDGLEVWELAPLKNEIVLVQSEAALPNFDAIEVWAVDLQSGEGKLVLRYRTVSGGPINMLG